MIMRVRDIALLSIPAHCHIAMACKLTYRLVTVNTAPERAKRLIGRVTTDLQDQYVIQHVGNCESSFSEDTFSVR